MTSICRSWRGMGNNGYAESDCQYPFIINKENKYAYINFLSNQDVAMS
ncbi:hypothetical protein GCM10027286_22980 [Virgibacillus ainsalahensis]